MDEDVDLDDVEPAHLFEWTPERAGAIVKAAGYVLHTADSVAHVPGGEELWKATEQDAHDAGEPLARILNRYDSARRLVGMVDEAEFAAAMLAYAKRNLRTRGQLVRAEKARAEEEAPRYGGAAFEGMAGEPPAFVVPEGPAPERRPEDPSQPEPFAFDPWASVR